MSAISDNQKQSLTENADRTELLSVMHGVASIEAGARAEQVAGALDDHEYREGADGSFVKREAELLRGEKDDVALESIVGGIRAELERRIKCVNRAYPFALKQNNLVYQGKENGLYEFLLSISSADNIATKNLAATQLFERISCKVVATYFGKYAREFHTGFPRDDGSSFKEKMREIADATGEFAWGPEGHLASRKPKDEGVDFVIYLKDGTERKACQLFILGQCACGHGWESKIYDLRIEKMAKWFNPMTIIPPVMVFSAPHHVVDGVLKETSRATGLVFDRARLALTLAHANPNVLDDDIRKKIKILTKQLLDEHR
ncbi:MAG: hypothetical protein OD918_00425 [Gammaproteobacteria bacterium]